MPVSAAQLDAFLKSHGAVRQEGYNYVIYTIRTGSLERAGLVVMEIEAKRKEIEEAYRLACGASAAGWKLADKAAMAKPRSVVVPTPFGTELNVLTSILRAIFSGTRWAGVELPLWG